MKKYKSPLLFLTACLIVTGFILLINTNLSKILPDYKNQPSEYEHTIYAGVSSTNDETNENSLPTVTQLSSFYNTFQSTFTQATEAAEKAVERAQGTIPKQAKQIIGSDRYQLTVFSSTYQTIGGRRYYKIIYDALEGNVGFRYSLIYSEDKTEILFQNNRMTNIFMEAHELESIDIREAAIENCRSLLSDSGTKIDFQPDEFWDSGSVSNIHAGSREMTNYYLLRDNTHKITLEYNLEDNEILSFSIGR